MTHIVDIVKLDSVEAMETFIDEYIDVELEDFVHLIVKHDCINLFKHYIDEPDLDAIEASDCVKIQALMAEQGKLPNEYRYGTPSEIIEALRRKEELDIAFCVEFVLRRGSIKDVHALVECLGLDVVKANGQGCEQYARPDVMRYYYDTIVTHRPKTWDPRLTPEAAEVFRQYCDKAPTIHDMAAALEGNLALYRWMQREYDVRPPPSQRMFVAACQYGEEADIREHWIGGKKVMHGVFQLWRRNMWHLAKELVGEVPEKKVIDSAARKHMENIKFIQGITFMDWKKHITVKSVKQKMDTAAAAHTYWPWFEDQTCTIGIYFAEEDILCETRET